MLIRLKSKVNINYKDGFFRHLEAFWQQYVFLLDKIRDVFLSVVSTSTYLVHSRVYHVNKLFLRIFFQTIKRNKIGDGLGRRNVVL